jgi:hypothetical protein
MAAAWAMSGRPVVRADYNTITDATLAHTIETVTITAGGSYTQVRPFVSLPSTVAQSVQVQGTGTSPNYKVEMLVSVNGVTYVKPETGGDLGTFTDANAHIMAVHVPLSVGHKLKITELGGANSITIEAWERSQ